MKSYQDLEIYQKSFALFVEVHPFTLELPKFELFELGSQIRRSADSVISNIVEGYGRRIYKADFVRFLVYANASNLETQNHLEKIAFLYPDKKEKALNYLERYKSLGAQIYSFIEYVRKNWKS